MVTEATEDGETRSVPKPEWPELQAEIEDLWEQEDFEAALAICTRARRLFPERPNVFRMLSKTLLNLGDAEEAERMLAAAHRKGLPEDQFLSAKLGILWQTGDKERYLKTAQALRKYPDHTTVLLLSRMVDTMLDLQEWDQAAATANTLIRMEPTAGHMLKKIQARLEAGDPDTLTSVYKDPLLGLLPEDEFTDLMSQLQRFVTVRSQAAVDRLHRACQRWPRNTRLQHILEAMERVTDGSDGDAVSWHVPRSRSLQEQLSTVLERLHGNKFFYNPDENLNVASAMERQISASTLKRELTINPKEKAVVISDRAPGGKVAVVFTGLLDQTALPSDATDAFLAAAGYTTIYVKDFERLMYGNGIKALGPDLESSAAALRQIIDGMGDVTHVLAMGFSAGGFGAINFGMALKADRVLCFSPPTMIEEGFLQKVGDRRGRLLLARLKRSIAPEMLVAAPRIAAQEDPVQIDLIYGEHHHLDRSHSEALGGLPGVSLYPIRDYDGHNSVVQTILDGHLLPILDGDMSGLEG